MIKFAIDDGIDPPPHPGGTRGNASRIRYMDEYSVETVGNSRVVKGGGKKKRGISGGKRRRKTSIRRGDEKILHPVEIRFYGILTLRRRSEIACLFGVLARKARNTHK